MQLLDAVLAFALTLAALATVVTIMMEAGHRIFLMRKKNLIDVMKLLNEELAKRGTIGGKEVTAEHRWNFIVSVVNNPARGLADEFLKQTSKVDVADLLDRLRHGEGATGTVSQGPWRWFKSLLRRGTRRNVYDKVTLEHVLRRLAEIEPVATELQKVDKESAGVGTAIRAELDRIARRYEEFGSAVSAEFKRKAQRYSVVVGVLLALVANVDGYRVFSAYMSEPALAARVIAQQETLEQRQRSAAERSQELETARLDLEKAESDLRVARARGVDPNSDDFKALQTARDAKADALSKLVGVDAALEEAKLARQAFDELAAAGVPVGAAFFPHCTWSDSAKDTATCNLRPEDELLAWIAWLLSAVVTGVLLGLGAPFWFDVAKKLAQVRQAFRGGASGEVRMSGQDSDGTAESRTTIIDGVIKAVPPKPEGEAGGRNGPAPTPEGAPA